MTTRPLPAWFDDAKLGIFVHWGLYSVPAWAEQGLSPLEHPDAAQGFRHNTYAEWYLNSITLDGTEARRHHEEAWGSEFSYDDFAPMFKDASARFRPDAWADLFRRAGAGYVVLGTKHHDGFLMWPSDNPNPHKPGWQSDRDLVGELSAAVRGAGMRMGLYYSGGLDWTFQGLPIADFRSMIAAIPQTPEYAAYADSHWRELIERYQPSVLWNDIHYPADADAAGLFEHYYAQVPDGVVNNRFDMPASKAGRLHADFETPEYTTMDEISPTKWETCRGVGQSFGLNRNETDDHRVATDDLVRMFVDVVAKNGNMLLNVGPAADGSIPWAQASRLLGLGWWLATNGEAIYGTRPWERAEGVTGDGLPVRFTAKGDVVYATVLGAPTTTEVTIEDAPLASTVRRLGDDADARTRRDGTTLRIILPVPTEPTPAVSFRLTP